MISPAKISRRAEPGEVYDVSTGGPFYRVNAVTGECACAHYVYRLQGKQAGAVCKHGKALRQYLSFCPLCGGTGRKASCAPALLQLLEEERARSSRELFR